MAEFRRVDPAYAEDVDTMMVEYTAYNAVIAQLALLEALITTQYPRDDRDQEPVFQAAEAAIGLSEVYEVLINLFRQKHDVQTLSEATRLDGMLLGFLTLLNIWMTQQAGQMNGDLFDVSPQMVAGLRRDQIINKFLRQRWLHTRPGSSMAADGSTWNGRSSRTPNRDQSAEDTFEDTIHLGNHVVSRFIHLLDHILPRFIHISHQVHPKAGRPLEVWMLLASKLMINAAVEIMTAPNFLHNGVTATRLAIEECFAWGYVPRNDYGVDSPLRKRLLSELQRKAPELVEGSEDECRRMINHTLTFEDKCLEMFHDTERHGAMTTDDNDAAHGELIDWTRVRREALSEALGAFDSYVDKRDPQDRWAPIKWLQDKYRLSVLLSELTEFLRKTWTIYHSDEWHGKPVLVQIEQGRVQGMSNDDFLAFKQRAAIN